MNTKLAFFAVAIAFYAFVTTDAASDVDCSTPPEIVEPKICCPIPEIFDSETKEKCQEFAKQLSDMNNENDDDIDDDDDGDGEDTRPRPRPHPHPRPHHHPHHHQHICFMECVLNGTNIIDEEHNIHHDNLNQFLNEALKDNDDLISVVSQAFDTCAAKAAAFRAKHAENFKNRPAAASNRMRRLGCRPHRAMLMGCVLMETFSNCPASIWTDTEECNNSRAFFNACIKH